MQPVMQERLRRYVSLKKENENRIEKLLRLKAEAEFPAKHEPDGSQHSGHTGERMARATERYVEYEKRMRPLLAANKKEMAEIEDAVNALESPAEREVLRMRYMDSECYSLPTWEEIACELYGDADHAAMLRVHRLHARALKSLELRRD